MLLLSSGEKMVESSSLWQTEYLKDSYGQTYRLKRKILAEKSPYQKIELVETWEFGKMLLLDGAVQTTEKDEFIYHEMLVHPALLTHPEPERVLIVGGGDGGSLRRVLEHPVKEAVMVEMDRRVVEISREYLPGISREAFEDERTNLIFANGYEFLKKEGEKPFDVILIDSTDPIGKAAVLFSREFYQLAFSSLTEEGILVTQSGSVFYQLRELRQAYNNLKQIFPRVFIYLANVPSYPGCLWSFVLGSKHHLPPFIPLLEKEKRLKTRNLKTLYYNLEIDLAAFALPTFLKESLNEAGST